MREAVFRRITVFVTVLVMLLYLPSNVHLTPEGHKALAEAVAPAVRTLLRP